MGSANDFTAYMDYESMRTSPFDIMDHHGASPMNTATSSASVSRHDSMVDAPTSTLPHCNQYNSFLPQSEVTQHPIDSAWQSQRQSPAPSSFLDSQHGTPSNWHVSSAPHQSSMAAGSFHLPGIDHAMTELSGSCAIPMDSSKRPSPEAMSEEG